MDVTNVFLKTRRTIQFTPRRGRAIAAFALLLLSGSKCVAQTTQPTFTNPLKLDGADPWLAWWHGEYFLTTTTGRDVRMRHATTLEGLKAAADVVVWDARLPEPCTDVWATEFHRFKDDDGQPRWYGYYTASRPSKPGQRMFVIESDGDEPAGPYHFKALLKTDADDRYFAIDGSPIEAADGSLAFVWSGQPSDTAIGLYLCRMTNPWTLDGPRHVLPADGFGCGYVREGPVALRHGDKVFLTYSMCGTPEPDYRLGMLIADARADLSDPKSWSQHPEVVFHRDDAAGVYGPGHNFFFKSPDGTQDWIVYHAKTTTRPTYDDRTTRAQPFTWSADGLPRFGTPIATDVPLPEPSGTGR